MTPAQFRTAPLGPMIAKQSQTECLRLLRIPAFSIASIVLPIMFFAFFGLSGANTPAFGTTAGKYLLASFAAYAVVNIALFSFGASVAAERGTGATTLMRAAPLQPMAYFIGKLVAALAFAAVALIALIAFAEIAGGIRVAPGLLAALVLRLLFGSIPFVLLGFAIGYLANINAAIAIINLTYLPLAFASGLFVPLIDLPRVVQHVAPYLPTYHFAQLAWTLFGAGSESVATAILWLAGYTAAFLFIALRAYWREEKLKFT